MKINFRNLGLAAAFLTVLYSSSACNEATVLGKDLIPGSDFVEGKDTTLTNIITHNIFKPDSSVFTGRANYSKALGSIVNDPLFGRSHGFVYTQVSLPGAAFKFEGTGQTLDSVVLCIGMEGYYGDSLSTQTFNVYKMTEPDFKIDSNYRYYQQLAYDRGQLLGTATVVPRWLKDSVSVYGTREAPQLRIRLNSSFGNELLQQKPEGAFATDSAFHVFLKGLALVPDTNLATNHTMLYLNLNTTPTRLQVFYKNTENDSLVASFPFDAGFSAHANYFVRNYAGSQALRYLNTNREGGDSLLFLQAAPGIFTRITIPGLQDFPLSVVNKAELVVTEITTGPSDLDDVFTEPEFLNLLQYTIGDTTKFLIDYGNPSSPNIEYFGGRKEVVTNFGGVKVSQYKFNIGQYLQRLFRKQEINNGFKLEAISSRNIDVQRVKTGGGSHSQYNLKLRIIYTKL